MNHIEVQMKNVLAAVGGKAEGVQQVVRAKKLQDEIRADNLEKVLAEHIPAEDPQRLKAAAQDMVKAIDDVYSMNDQTVDDAWIIAQLNTVLAKKSSKEKGKYLVALMKCSRKNVPEEVAYYTRWFELAQAEDFSEEDVYDLLDIIQKHITDSAGFMAQQEFRSMEKLLDKLPDEKIQLQLDCGKELALAYAAVMYIDSAKNEAGAFMTAYQYGAVAAQSVENSRLFALYCSGKIETSVLKGKMENLAKAVCTNVSKYFLQAMALGLRFITSKFATRFIMEVLSAAGMVSTGSVAALTVVFFLLMFATFDQESAAKILTDMWADTVKIAKASEDFFAGVKAHLQNSTRTDANDTVVVDGMPVTIQT